MEEAEDNWNCLAAFESKTIEKLRDSVEPSLPRLSKLVVLDKRDIECG